MDTPELEIEPVASLEEARPDWTRLAEASRNPFATWEWAEAWWRTFGEGRELALHRARDADGRCVAILPLYRADRGPLALLRFLGHGPADELGPVCAPADRVRAVGALAAVRRRALPRRGLLLAERVPAGTIARASVVARVVREEPSPSLPVANRTWDEWLAGKSGNFRSQMRRRERKLERDRQFTTRLATPETIETDFETLVRLHERRWEDGASVAFAGARGAFHREFARRAVERGWARLMIGEIDGAAAAAIYTIRFGGSDWYYQSGRDPAWNDYRVGLVVLVRSIRAAFDDGMDAFHFGLGGEEYKDRFAEADPGLESALLGTLPTVGVLSALIRGARRLPGQHRRRIGRHVA